LDTVKYFTEVFMDAVIFLQLKVLKRFNKGIIWPWQDNCIQFWELNFHLNFV